MRSAPVPVSPLKALLQVRETSSGGDRLDVVADDHPQERNVAWLRFAWHTPQVPLNV